jgi:hypothetical protein
MRSRVSAGVKSACKRSRSEEFVVERRVPDSACHAGGRGFESRRSDKTPANRHVLLPFEAQTNAGLRLIPHMSRTESPQRAGQSGEFPQPVVPADLAGALCVSNCRSGRLAGIFVLLGIGSRLHPAQVPRAHFQSEPDAVGVTCTSSQVRR